MGSLSGRLCCPKRIMLLSRIKKILSQLSGTFMQGFGSHRLSVKS
jgi:hypothetical protein